MSVSVTHPRNNPDQGPPWARAQTFENCLLVVLGFAREYIAHLFEGNREIHVVVLDPDIDPKSIPERRHLQIFNNFDDLGREFPFVMARRYKVRVTALPGLEMIYPKEWKALLEFCDDQVHNIESDTVTACRFSREWQRNTLLNLRWIRESAPVRRVFDKWKGKPAILLSSGPSLDDHLQTLKKLKGKAFVLAVGSTAPKLTEMGIEPDAYMAFDAGLANWIGHFEDVESDVPLIYDPIVYHQIPTAWKGPRVIMQIWPFNFYRQTFGDIGTVQVGPSISNTGFDLLGQMGADPIILLGQDLCYRGDQIHATGTHLHRLRDNLTTERFDKYPLLGVNGGQMTGNLVFRTFWNTFNVRIAQLKKKRTVRVINSSFGVKIEGTEDVCLEDIPLDRDLSKDLAEIRGLFEAPHEIEFDRILELLGNCKREAESLYKAPELRVFPRDLVTPPLEPLAFTLQPIWGNSRCEKDKGWAAKEVRAGLRYAIPLLEKTINKLSAG